MKDGQGFSVYFCFGKYAGFGAFRDGRAYRIILGWFAVGVMFFDLELFLEEVGKVLQDTTHL